MLQTPSCISIHGGGYFDILNPESSEYSIETIAHALSFLCRYTGHVSRFYSVAEHSVLVSYQIDPKYALEGLLHDAAEAFLGDVSSPLKKLLPDYKVIERNVEEEIWNRFSLCHSEQCELEIHKADKRVYWAERKMIAPSKDTLWHQGLGASRKVTPVGWWPNEAKYNFLTRYQELTLNDRNEFVHGEGTPEVQAS